jgi:phosphinothricin acetyltransferase
MDLSIRMAAAVDAAAVARIYNHYVATSCATFETEPVSAQDMAARIAGVVAAGLPWLVAETPAGIAGIAGYAYAEPWKARSAYRHSAETSVYLAPARTGQGIGQRLYVALIDALRALPIHAVIGGVALPNPACVALHERLGFRKVAQFEQVGHKHDRWIDVAYWQLLL